MIFTEQEIQFIETTLGVPTKDEQTVVTMLTKYLVTLAELDSDPDMDQIGPVEQTVLVCELADKLKVPMLNFDPLEL